MLVLFRLGFGVNARAARKSFLNMYISYEKKLLLILKELFWKERAILSNLNTL